MLEKVEGTSLVNIRDRWVWSLEGSGEFSVASVRRLIEDYMLLEVTSKTRWMKAVPIKVNVLAWKVKLNCLPIRLNISRRGMYIESILCPMCGDAAESTRYNFFTCHIAREILRKISRWRRFSPFFKRRISPCASGGDLVPSLRGDLVFVLQKAI
ncbi:RNA-directed DNA polymerase, eukaryota [Tanacetum coccineum]